MRCCHSLLNMAIGPFVILLLLRLTQAQFIQHYNYGNGVPNWRRQIAPHILNQPVIVPDFPIYLEYNCWKILISANGRRGLDLTSSLMICMLTRKEHIPKAQVPNQVL
jgi:hypothetical protein